MLKALGQAPKVTRLLTKEGAEFEMHANTSYGIDSKAITGTLGNHEVTLTNSGYRSVWTPQGVRYGEGPEGAFRVEDSYKNFSRLQPGELEKNKALFRGAENNFYSGRAPTKLFQKLTEIHMHTAKR